MTEQEKQKLRPLQAIARGNYRITRLYSAFLSRDPELVDPALFEATLRQYDADPADVYASFLSVAFGLDTESSREDADFERDWLLPSVTCLDPADYLADEYCRTVQPPRHSLGAWELKQEVYPACRGFLYDDFRVLPDRRELPRLGFFRQDFPFLAALENGNEWMTLTPVEINTSRAALAAARGRVCTYGLGLGYYAFHAAAKSTVDSVTVVERSPEVIRLFRDWLLPQFPCRDKIELVQADALEYAAAQAPREGFDTLFADIWRDASDGLALYLRLKKLEPLCPDTRFDYWLEGSLLSRLRWLVFENALAAIERGDPAAPRQAAEVEALLTDTALRSLAGKIIRI